MTETHRPRLWPCSWNYCPQSFRTRSDLIKHMHDVHFNNVFCVKKRNLDAYLRATEGRSGYTDSLLADLPTQHSTQFGMNSSQRDGGEANIKPQSSSPHAARRHPRNQHAASGSPVHPVRVTTTPPPAHSGHLDGTPVSSRSSDMHSTKRQRTSFASYAAQSSPMSTPSVASMPPSPALSNKIADAINASARINAGPSPPSRTSRSPVKSQNLSSVASATSGSSNNCDGSMGSGHKTYPPIPRRTNLGVSPTPNGPRNVAQLRSTLSVSSGTSAAHIVSPAALSVVSRASAQAVEDELTQGVSATNSPSTSQSQNASRTSAESLQYPDDQESISPKSQSHPEPHPGLSGHSSGAGASSESYHGSHAVSPYPPTSVQSLSLSQIQALLQSQAVAAATLSPPPHPASQSPPDPSSQAVPKSKPVIPRTRRARSKEPAPASQPLPAPTRALRSRSKTPAPAPTPATSQRPVPPIPRRTTRSRASSNPASAAAPRAASAAPEGGVRRSTRASSKPPSAGNMTGAGKQRPHPGAC
ncbi:hypothetical protein BD413DRAFT_574844 [Trametes elegans]|nr:hypothetical protein BD413DRAFT_574844 [Trametes elegans]